MAFSTSAWRVSRWADVSRIVVRIEAKRLFNATRFSARWVTCPSALASCTTRSTNRRRRGHGDGRGDARHHRREVEGHEHSEHREEREQALGEAGCGERPVATHPLKVHAPAQVEEHETECEIHEDACGFEQRGEFMASHAGAAANPTAT